MDRIGIYPSAPSARKTKTWNPLRDLFQRRKNRHRGWKWIRLWWVPLELVLVALVVWGLDTGWQLLADPMTLPVKDVRVVGDLHHVSSEVLRGVLLPVATGGFLRVDLMAVRRAAVTLPWVEDAQVRRLWPDTLRVTVIEQIPVARWLVVGGGGGGGLLNDRGEIFTPDPSTYPEGLPTLEGVEGSAIDMLGHLRRLDHDLARIQLSVTGLTVDNRRAWVITLNNGMRLLLGTKDLENRLARFIQVYPSALASQAGRIVRVDLRYSNGFAVGWKPAT